MENIERLIAKAPNIGFRTIPKDEKTPAAIGIQIEL